MGWQTRHDVIAAVGGIAAPVEAQRASGLRELWAYAPRIYPLRTADHALKRLKFRLRCLWRRRVMQAWLRCLSSVRLAPLLAARPRLLEKPQRPYLSCRWAIEQRARALQAHYGFLQARLPDALLRALYDGTGLRLAQAGESGASLWLGYDDQFEKEGELTLSLRRAAGERLVSATFSVHAARRDGAMLMIGCMQGADRADRADRADGRDCARELTRQMHGLRPKPLMLLAIQEITRHWGLAHLLAVADHGHVYRGVRYALRQARVLASYDALWQEHGGVYAGDGFYALPLVTRERTREEIDPRKRALYARRYELTAQLCGQIRAALAA